MDALQLLWVINSVLVLALGFFIKVWMNDLKDKVNDLKKELYGKMDTKTCDFLHKDIKKYAHTHGDLGSSGEVVKL